MGSQFYRRLATVRDSPMLREYGSLFVLLLGSRLLWILMSASVEMLSDLMPTRLDPRLVGTVVYAILGVALVAAVYAVYQYLQASAEGLDRQGFFTLFGALGMLFLVIAYRLHEAMDLPIFPGDIVPSLLRGVIAMGLLALVYARVRGINIQTGFSGRDIYFLAVIVALVSALAGIGWVITYTAIGNTGIISVGGVFGPRFSGPQLSAGVVIWSIVLPGVFFGGGMGLLYNGVIQEGLRGYMAPTSAVAAVTALIGVSFLNFETGWSTDVVATVTTTTIVVLLSLLAAFLAVQATRILSQVFDIELPLIVGASIGVFLLMFPVLRMSMVQPSPARFVLAGGSLTVVAAIAAIGYERSRSVWVPTLAFALFRIIADAKVALYLAKFLR